MPDVQNNNLNNTSDSNTNARTTPVVPSPANLNPTPPRMVVEAIEPPTNSSTIETTNISNISGPTIESNPQPVVTTPDVQPTNPVVTPSNSTNPATPPASTDFVTNDVGFVATTANEPIVSTPQTTTAGPSPINPKPKSIKTALIIGVVLFLSLAIPATVYLAQKSQENRQHAQTCFVGGQTCYVDGQCCSGSCSNFLCTYVCGVGGESCTAGPCCSGYHCVNNTFCVADLNPTPTPTPTTCTNPDPCNGNCCTGYRCDNTSTCVPNTNPTPTPTPTPGSGQYDAWCPGSPNGQEICEFKKRPDHALCGVCDENNFLTGDWVVEMSVQYACCNPCTGWYWPSIGDRVYCIEPIPSTEPNGRYQTIPAECASVQPCAGQSPGPSSTPRPSITPNPTPPGSSPQPTPTPTLGGMCQDLKFYRVTNVADAATWIEIPDAQLPTLRPGDIIYVTVLGTTTNDTVDRARIRVNSSAWSTENETYTKKPGSEEFWILYTIPDSVTAFNFGAEVHAVTQNKWL